MTVVIQSCPNGCRTSGGLHEDGLWYCDGCGWFGQPTVWAATRDASWYVCPDTRTTKRYHVATTHGEAACRAASNLNRYQTIPLDECSRTPAAEVPPRLRCRRPACADLFPPYREG
jgi:hypothetical protein